MVYLRKIGDMDEGIVEGCEDAGDAKDEFTCFASIVGDSFYFVKELS